MSLLDDILAHNREYVEDQNTGYVETDTKCSKNAEPRNGYRYMYGYASRKLFRGLHGYWPR